MSFDLLFLGTCACDFSPRLKTDLKDRFDENARRSSAVLMNGTMLIDAGVHVLESMRIAGVDATAVTDIFLTHLHSDHFNRSNVAALAKAGGVRLWVREGADIEPIPGAVIIEMTQFREYAVSEELTVTGIPANHDPKAHPQHLIFKGMGKSLFYGCDGGWLLHDSFKFLGGASLDCMILDATVGDYVGDFRMGEHNSIPMIRLMLPSLKTVGAITDKTRICLSHVAPSLHKEHRVICEQVKDIDATVAYDGMTLII